jgi:hypothetical protein
MIIRSVEPRIARVNQVDEELALLEVGDCLEGDSSLFPFFPSLLPPVIV